MLSEKGKAELDKIIDKEEIDKIQEYLSEKTYLDQTPLEINFEGKDKL